jgi:cytoskeletal protein RodZ
MQFGKDAASAKGVTLGKELRKILLFAFAIVAIVVVLWVISSRILEQYGEKGKQAAPAETGSGGQKKLPPGEEDPKPPDEAESSPTTRDHGALARVEDYKGLQQDSAYNFILRKMHQMSQAEIKFAAKNNYHVTAGNLLARPDEYRGDFFMARGTVVHIDTLKLNTNPVNVEDVYEVYLVDLNRHSTDGYYVHVIERPKMPRLGIDQAQVEGVFFKIFRYETRSEEARFVPFIFGKRLVVEETPKFERTTQDIEYFIVGLLALSFGAVLVISFATRKGDKMMMDALAKVRISHAQKKSGPAVSTRSSQSQCPSPDEASKELSPDAQKASGGEEAKKLPPDEPDAPSGEGAGLAPPGNPPASPPA